MIHFLFLDSISYLDSKIGTKNFTMKKFPPPPEVLAVHFNRFFAVLLQ